MAVIALGEVPGATPEHYERINEALGIRNDEPPPGLIQHAAGVSDGGILIVDVWESPEALQRMFEERNVLQVLEREGLQMSGPPRFVPVHNMIARGLGSEPNVLMMFETEELAPEQYDEMTSSMDAHRDGGKRHPAYSHVAGRTDSGGVLVVDLWDSPESFGRFAEEQVVPAAGGRPLPIEPRFIPVHNVIHGEAPAAP